MNRSRALRRSLELLAIIACGGGVLVAINVANAKGGRPPKREISSRLRAHYSILRMQTGRAAVAPSPDVASSLRAEHRLADVLGLDQAALQRVSLGQGGVWVEPGQGGICVTLDVTVGGDALNPWHCERTAAALTYGVVAGGRLVGPAGATYLAWGVVPDGNGTVAAELASGASVSIGVSDNAFFAETPSQVISLTFGDATARTVTVPTAPR